MMADHKSSSNSSSLVNSILGYLVSPTFFWALLLVIGVIHCGSWHSSANEEKVSEDNSMGRESVSPKPHKLVRSQQAAGRQPQPTVGHAPAETVWNEYVNSEYRYKIRYPSTSKLDISDPSHVIIEFVEAVDAAPGRNAGLDVLTFEIAVYKNPKGLTARQWWNEDEGINSILEEGSLQIAGYDAYRIKALGGDESDVFIYLSVDGNMYELQYQESITDLSEEANARLSGLFKKMLGSFSLGINRPCGKSH
jgi:hypothetical protein